MELKKDITFEFFIRFAEGLQKLLGNKCEIIIHDFRKGFEHTIVHAINGQVSGRSVGGPPRGGMISHTGEDIHPYKDSRIYFYNGTDELKGKIFKSCTTLISDENNKIIGSVCLNLEMNDFILAQNALQKFVNYNTNGITSDNEENIAFKNVDEFLNYYMNQCVQIIGKPMPLMDKGEKIQALKYLNNKGIFKISKANVILTEAFQISKFTLYSYLEEAKGLIDSENDK